MNKIIIAVLIGIILISCEEQKSPVITDTYFNIKSRTVDSVSYSGMNKGKTYLSVYSQIYESSKFNKYNLTMTVSIRNADATNKCYLLKADYYDTDGNLINEYLSHSIYLNPMETIEIVVDESDKSGGTGGNFIFHWANEGKIEPLFEAVMISTKSQQGISFVTTGIRIE